MEVAVGMRLFEECRLHQSDIALCMALRNELPESLAIKVRRLLEIMGRKNFRSGLGKDDRVDVLTDLALHARAEEVPQKRPP